MKSKDMCKVLYRVKIRGGITALLFILFLLCAFPVSASVSEKMADTSIRLLREVTRSSTAKNVLISPDSVFTAVAMVENGATGKTLREMQSTMGGMRVKALTDYLSKLHSRLSGSKQFTYQTANSIWYKKGLAVLKKTFIQKTRSVFGAEIIAAPFNSGTVSKINAWVKEHTNGKIPSIIDRLDPSDRVVVLNAVYFNGNWVTPYKNTRKRTFTSSNGKTKKVNMLEGTEYTYVEIDGAEGFLKPYSGGKTAFLALLPPKGTSVNAYLKKLSGKDLIRGYKNRKSTDIIVNTRMPVFSYDYSTSLKNPLKRMGIKNAFSPEKADFSKMSEGSFYIDDVIHKTHIDVTKSGTEAAAVTAVTVKNTSFKPVTEKTVKNVYLNRPFVYAIIDTQSGIPLFMGVVNRMG